MRPRTAVERKLCTRKVAAEAEQILPVLDQPQGMNIHDARISTAEARAGAAASHPPRLSGGARKSEPTVLSLGVVSLALGGRFEPGSSGTPPPSPSAMGVVLSGSVGDGSSDASLPHDDTNSVAAIAIVAIRARLGWMRWASRNATRYGMGNEYPFGAS